MAAPPVLLVADDLAVIASVKRVLAREGYECVLATNAADALIAWGHSLPGLILLQPGVESDRGGVVLEELAAHPEARLLRVVLLGESVPGFPWPVEPLPLDPQGFAQTVADNFRSANRLDGWKVLETTPAPKVARTEEQHEEPDPWRATRPSQAFASSDTLTEEPVPRLVTVPASLSQEDSEAPAAPPAFAPIEVPPGPSGAPPEQAAEPPTPPEGLPAISAPVLSLPEEPPTASMARPGGQPEEAHTEHAVTAVGPAAGAARGDEEALTPPPGDLPALEAAVPPDAGSEAPGPGDAAADETQLPPDLGEESLASETGAASSPGEAATALTPPSPEGSAESLPGAAAGEQPSLSPEGSAEPFPDAATGDQPSLSPEGSADSFPGAAAGEQASRSSEGGADSFPGEDAAGAQSPPPDAGGEPPSPGQPATDTQYPGVEPPAPSPPGLADALFGDLPGLEESIHRDVEAQVRASVESTLASQPVDDELQRLEDEVRAEAQRRRIAREEKSRAVLTTQQAEAVEPALPPPALGAPFESSESDFSGLAEDATPAQPPAVPTRAAELLARAEQLMLEGRAVAEARRREADADARKRTAELEAVERRVETAEDLVRKERDARAEVEDAHERLSEEFDRLTAELELAKTEAAEVAETRDAQESQRRAELEAERDEARHEAEVLGEQLERHVTEAKAAREAAARAVEALELELQAAKDAADSTAKASEHSLAEAVEQRDEAREALEALTKRAASLEVDLGAATDKLDETIKERDELKSTLGVAQGDLERTTGELERSMQEISGLTRAAEEARAQAAGATKATEEAREQLKGQLDELRTRAEAAEDRAALAQEKVDTLEKRALAPLALPGGRVVGVPRTGTVGLDLLARLVGQLVLAQADGRLELGVPGGLRTLWFKRGAVLAAESTLEHESLVDRARRDGLIDARQEAELRMLKTATPREQLEALKTRGAIRDVEVVPLVQRYTEQTALEAFTEASTNYRLVDEPPTDSVLIAAVPRATLPMLAESLRRAVPPDALLEQLGGGEAVPQPTDAELDLRALGFSERERKMLTWADGEATVEDLSLASGLKPDLAFRALLVAKLLGLLEVTAPKEAAPVVDAELDVRRLEAKYDEVQDADYFTILGLPRTAGAEDVQRAFHRLGGEFDPLRFSGHPDASLQQRAQVVYRLLEEAARALEDDRRRTKYARHLLD